MKANIKLIFKFNECILCLTLRCEDTKVDITLCALLDFALF